MIVSLQKKMFECYFKAESRYDLIYTFYECTQHLHVFICSTSGVPNTSIAINWL